MNVLMIAQVGKKTDELILKVAKQRNYTVTVINPDKCLLSVKQGMVVLFHDGQPITQADACLVRHINYESYDAFNLVLRHIQAMGISCFNNAQAFFLAKNKFLTLQRLAQHNIPIPHSVLGCHRALIPALAEHVTTQKRVVKTQQGSVGTGVFLTHHPHEVENLVATLYGSNNNPLVQEFVEGVQGKSIRCFVIGDAIVASVEFEAGQEDFRSNFTINGIANEVDLTQEEQEIALKATKVMGLSYAGVDLLRAQDGTVVIEVNSTPGAMGPLKLGIDIPTLLLDFVEKSIH